MRIIRACDRIVEIEYIITNQNGLHIVTAWRKDSDMIYGDFKNVSSMKAYLEGLYRNKLKFIRLYEKEVENG